MQIIHTDLLTIGAGLAGERCAIEVAGAGFSVVCLSLVPARRSHSVAAQGGMQAALGNAVMGDGDSPDVHFLDTVKGSDWGADQEVARMFVEAAPIEMRRLAHWGVPWNRVVAGTHTYWKGGKPFDATEKAENHGLIHSRAFGGTAKWRTCYASDGAGHAVLYTMDNRAAQLGVTVHDRSEAVSLIHDGETCHGAIVRCLRTGELRAYLARATLIASGGYGRIYRASTNAIICEGTGLSLALDTGVAKLGNMEAVQFHPTGTVPTDILVTEGCRGDGGTLLDRDEYRFMPDYEPDKAELASRDVVSRRMIEHMRTGKGVQSPYGEHLWLDIRHLGEKHIRTKLREVDEICQNFLGIDPLHQLIPVRPTQHYSMGGVRTDKTGAAYGLTGTCTASTGWAATRWRKPWWRAASWAATSRNSCKGTTPRSPPRRCARRRRGTRRASGASCPGRTARKASTPCARPCTTSWSGRPTCSATARTWPGACRPCKRCTSGRNTSALPPTEWAPTRNWRWPSVCRAWCGWRYACATAR